MCVDKLKVMIYSSRDGSVVTMIVLSMETIRLFDGMVYCRKTITEALILVSKIIVVRLVTNFYFKDGLLFISFILLFIFLSDPARGPTLQ